MSNEKERTVTQLSIAKCCNCGERFQIRSDLLDCGLRCPHCKVVAKAEADTSGGASAVALAHAPRDHPSSARVQPTQPNGRPLTGPRRNPLAMAVLGSPGVIITVVGVVMLVLAMIAVSMAMIGAN
jgi:hypothetical protein